MGRKRKYNGDHLKRVFEIINSEGISKREAIAKAGFKNRQSYYEALISLNYEEVLHLVKKNTRIIKRKYKRKYDLDNLKTVVSSINKHKMSKSHAINSAGFKSRGSYYDTLDVLGYEERYSVRLFNFFESDCEIKSIVSFI